MFCVKCGSAIPDGAKFCPECGEPAKSTEKKTGEVKTTQFRCKGCGSVMDIDPNSPILHCPYCGSNELIQEDKEVTVERIRSQANKEVQAGWQQVRQKEIEESSKEAAYKREKDEIRSYHKGILFYLTILLAVFFAFTMVMAFEDKQFLPGIISVLQVVLCLVSILMGLRTIKEKGKGVRVILVILAVALLFPYLSLSTAADKKQRDKEIQEMTMIWPTHEMAQTLPEPSSLNGEISVNNDSYFSFDLYNLTKEDFTEYTQACIDKGYSVDAEWVTDDYYKAYNTDGYSLAVDFIELDPTQTSIRVVAPLEMTEVSWPDTEMVNLLPRPESTLGNIDVNREGAFALFVGNTTLAQYSQYVDACIAAGFDKNFSRGDESFTADHDSGYHLSVSYQGFNTMKVFIEEKGD